MNQSIPKIFKTYIAAVEFIGLTGLYFFSIFLMTGRLSKVVDTVFLLGYILLVLIRLILIKIFNPYDNLTKRGMIQEIKNVVWLDAWQLVFAILALYTSEEIISFTRSTFLIFFFLELVMDFVIRSSYKVFLTKYFKQSSASQKLLVITTSVKAENIIKTMKANEEWFYEISGCIILDRDMQGETILNIPVVAGRKELRDYIIYHVVDAVFIDGNMGSDEFHGILELLDKIGSVVYINMSNFGVKLANERVVRIGGFTTLASSMKEITPLQSTMKRALDIAGGLVGSILTLLILIVLYPAIKLDSPGPVFFAQKRVGQNGRIFNIYKFRSMYMDAEARKADLMKENKMAGLMFKMDNDPRITKVGRFIRKTSLDEFPQFFNVLKGDMSLVGTRPPTVNEFEQYHAHHKKRLSMKPGITGLWQISGRSDITDFEEVVRLDSEYIDSWNIGKDLQILIKTVFVVLKRDGSM